MKEITGIKKSCAEIDSIFLDISAAVSEMVTADNRSDRVIMATRLKTVLRDVAEATKGLKKAYIGSLNHARRLSKGAVEEIVDDE
jgi:hypothetical protein